LHEFLEPHINNLNEQTDQWLKTNGYKPIIPVDIKKMQLHQEELNQQEELLAKERQANQELDSSQRRREDIK